MSVKITRNRRWPAGALAVGLGITAAGWQFGACGPLPVEQQVCTAAWADLTHSHRTDSSGGTYSDAAKVWTMSGTSTATG